MLASAHLPHYKIFESKQAVERLANEYGAEVMEVQMALWIWSFMRVLVVTKEEVLNSEIEAAPYSSNG
jgi:hypothetical protein